MLGWVKSNSNSLSFEPGAKKALELWPLVIVWVGEASC